MYVDEQSLEGNEKKQNSYIRVIWLRWYSFKNVTVLCYQSIKSDNLITKKKESNLEIVSRQIQELCVKKDWTEVV